MPQKSLALEKGRALFDSVLCSAEHFPIAFTYGETRYRTLAGLPCTRRTLTQTPSGTELSAAWQVDDSLSVHVEARYCAAYGQSEYTVFFRNEGTVTSRPLSNVSALDHVFTGSKGRLRGIRGDHQFFYEPYDIDLTQQGAHMESTGGRATHVGFPYFNLVHGDGGTLIALGWAGTWTARFTQASGGAKTVLNSIVSLNTVLLPGESVRTGLVVLLPYQGRDKQDAMNLWREWFLNCNMPRANAQGEMIKPFSTAFFAFDTGLPNSDGSISERHFTWKPSLEKLLAEGIRPDFRWFDAGWYYDPAGNTVESNWWGTIGSWELDRDKWPGDTFRQSVDAFHQEGIKTLVWFEPERVTHVDDLVRNYGYKKEWAVEAGAITNNIGDPDCLAWTADRIIRMLEENNVDLFREDNNANHNGTWGVIDRAQTKTVGAPRWGLAENNSIVGHYALWDTILAFCARTGRCTYVDSCASGGGRNDIESLRRGLPFMRSDADRTTTALRLSMSASFNQWIPFHGANTKETADQLEVGMGRGSDAYTFRASYLPVLNLQEAFRLNPNLDYDTIRFHFNEWQSIRHLLVKDMYVLTPWHTRTDDFGWTAFAYDDPAAGESLLLAFRQEQCEDDSCTVLLSFARPDAAYELVNADTQEKQIFSGEQLRKGLTLTLSQPRSCLMYRVKRL